MLQLTAYFTSLDSKPVYARSKYIRKQHFCLNMLDLRSQYGEYPMECDPCSLVIVYRLFGGM
jgi:hypothetical protein